MRGKSGRRGQSDGRELREGEGGLTVRSKVKRLGDDVVIVKIEAKDVVLQSELERVLVRDKVIKVWTSSRGPVLGEIADLSDMVAEEVDGWSDEVNVE